MCSCDTIDAACLLFRRGGVACTDPPPVFAVFLETILCTSHPLLLLAALKSSLVSKSFWFDLVCVVACRIFQSCTPAPRSALACSFLADAICLSLYPFGQTLHIFDLFLYWWWRCRTVPVAWKCVLTVCNVRCWLLMLIALCNRP